MYDQLYVDSKQKTEKEMQSIKWTKHEIQNQTKKINKI